LGRDSAIVVVNNSPRLASDLSGLTYISFSEGSEERAASELEAWINFLKFKTNSNATNYLNNDPRLTLEEYIGRIRSQNSLSYYIANDNRALQVNDFPDREDFYLRDYFQMYSIVPIEKNCVFDFNFYSSFSIPKGFTKDDLIKLGHLDLSIKIGSSNLKLADIEIKEGDTDATHTCIVQLMHKKIKIDKPTDCTIQFKNPVSTHINVELFLLRYPTKGFSLRFEYTDKFKYDYHWFRTNVLMGESNMNIQTINKEYKDGFFIYTNDWMLVGEGVVACWYK
jgi:hypothetical protein